MDTVFWEVCEMVMAKGHIEPNGSWQGVSTDMYSMGDLWVADTGYSVRISGCGIDKTFFF